MYPVAVQKPTSLYERSSAVDEAFSQIERQNLHVASKRKKNKTKNAVSRERYLETLRERILEERRTKFKSTSSNTPLITVEPAGDSNSFVESQESILKSQLLVPVLQDVDDSSTRGMLSRDRTLERLQRRKESSSTAARSRSAGTKVNTKPGTVVVSSDQASSSTLQTESAVTRAIKPHQRSSAVRNIRSAPACGHEHYERTLSLNAHGSTMATLQRRLSLSGEVMVLKANQEKADYENESFETIQNVSLIDQTFILKPLEPLTRFKGIIGRVKLLSRLLSIRADENKMVKYLSFTQVKDQLKKKRTIYGEGLTFDVDYYMVQKENQITAEAKAVLSLSPANRTEDQLHMVLVALNNAVKEFSEFPIRMQQSLVRVGWYERFEANRVIIRQGHTADNFYFILSGTTVVTILETHPITGDSFVRTAAFLGRGKSFGELALMYGALRSATVSCQDDVELLAVSRHDFVDIFMHVEKDREPEHIQYLREVEAFQGWPIEELPWADTKICLLTYFRRGVVVCRDSNTSEWIYVVKTGRCYVLKCSRVSQSQPSLQHEAKYLPNITNQTGSQKQTVKNSIVYLRLKTLGPGDVFVLQHVIFSMLRPSVSLSLVSDGAEVVLVNKKFFQQYLTQELTKKLRSTIRPYPSEGRIQRKLEESLNWEIYKNETLQEYYEKRGKATVEL